MILTESSKSPASIAQSNKQWVANIRLIRLLHPRSFTAGPRLPDASDTFQNQPQKKFIYALVLIISSRYNKSNCHLSGWRKRVRSGWQYRRMEEGMAC